MICYVVSLWFGPRNSKGYSQIMDIDPYYLLKQHLKFLSNLKETKISQIIFVINKSNCFIDENVYTIINSYNIKIPINVFFRENDGYSYGAWETSIRKTLNQPYKYYFLIEDDYIPIDPNFYSPFIDKMDDNTSYVAQLYIKNHAAISNGLLDRDKALEVFKTQGKIFNLVDGATRETGTKNQTHFLTFFPPNSFKDISDSSYIPFFQSTDDSIIDYGDKNQPVIIKPIELLKFNFRLLEEKDLKFLNEVRNSYAAEYLHDSRIFTLEQTLEWFKTTSPNYFIIEGLDRNLGYFRITNYSKENKNLYIGADLHPLFSHRGLGYKIYKEFLPFIFEKYDLNKVSLEVLESNYKALNLYKKLGFVQEGIKREEILKNGKYINSVIMSLLAKDFNGYII